MKYQEQESSLVELKRELPKNDQIIKTIVAFCNQNGGKLVIGVSDDGTVLGVPEEQIQHVLEYLDKSIHEATAPSIIPNIYTQCFADKILLIIEVSSGMNKPYYVKSEGLERGVYIRLGRSTVRAHAEIIEELRWQSRGKDFDMMPVYNADKQDLDTKKINAFLKQRIRKRNVTSPIKDSLRAYHAVTSEHAHEYPTVAGILLFGKNPQHFFEHAIILSSHFSGTEGRTAMASKECIGDIISQYNEVFDFIISRLNHSFSITGRVRTEKLEIPEEALREVLVNALVHRNYHIKAPIKIAIYQNRIEIYSPGSFPGPLDASSLRMGLSYMRNRALCKVFRELGLIENMGTGLETVFSSYEKYGLNQPEICEIKDYVKCVLPRTLKTQSIRSHNTTSDTLNSHQEILNLFDRVVEISVGDVVKLLGIPRTTAGRRLAALTETGLLIKKGLGRATRYKKSSMNDLHHQNLTR